MLSRLLKAIELNRTGEAEELITSYPSLAMELTTAPELYEADFIHWLYKGDTALHLAAAAARDQVVKLLLKAGANPNASGNHRRSRPLHYAADGIPDLPAFDGGKQVATLKLLLDFGAEIDAQDKNGATALHRAVRARCADAVRFLLNRCCNPIIRNKSGSTPFHLAVQNTGRGGTGKKNAISGQHSIIEAFLEKGLSPNCRDAQGKTVIESAKSTWIRELLLDFKHQHRT